jgi:hypothetical protein
MGILLKGTTFATGDQVTAAKLNSLVDSATFTSDAVVSSGGLSLTTGSAPYKLFISDLGVTEARLAANSVSTTKIADANVTTVKILDANITTAKIADSNVTTAKIADLNVTTGKIADSAVTTAKLAQPLTRGTAVSASGSTVDFTSIPSWVKRITIAVDGISTNGATTPLLQIGAGSMAISGYNANVGTIGANDNSTSGFPTALGFPLNGGTPSTASTYYGILLLINISGNTWVCGGTVYPSTGSSSTTAGSIALSGSLDRIRLTTITGTTLGSGSFDAGTINIMYE